MSTDSMTNTPHGKSNCRGSYRDIRIQLAIMLPVVEQKKKKKAERVERLDYVVVPLESRIHMKI